MGSCGAMSGDHIAYNGFHIIRPHIKAQSRTWFDVRVFYIRVTNDLIDDSAPESLKLNLIPLEPETLPEINGKRCSLNSDGISSVLRRDRMDKKFEEVTFVSTDSELVPCTSFFKADEFAMPVIEVYTAGSVSGAPIILTETLQHKSQKDAYFSSEWDLLGADQYRSHKMEGEEEHVSLYWRRGYSEEEDGELTWFNSGVRVGVGIGLGVCLGVGLSVGLLLRTYQTATKTLRRRLL